MTISLSPRYLPLKLSERRLSKKELGSIDAAVIDEDFFKHAQIVRRDLGIDYLVGLTRHLIVGREDAESVSWARRSSSSGRAGRGRRRLASLARPRGQTGQARRPFESEAMTYVVAHLLIALSSPGSRLGFHEEVNGCIFDGGPRSSSAGESTGDVSIEPACLSRVAAKYRDAVGDLIRALRTYGGGGDDSCRGAGPGNHGVGASPRR